MVAEGGVCPESSVNRRKDVLFCGEPLRVDMIVPVEQHDILLRSDLARTSHSEDDDQGLDVEESVLRSRADLEGTGAGISTSGGGGGGDPTGTSTAALVAAAAVAAAAGSKVGTGLGGPGGMLGGVSAMAAPNSGSSEDSRGSVSASMSSAIIDATKRMSQSQTSAIENWLVVDVFICDTKLDMGTLCLLQMLFSVFPTVLGSLNLVNVDFGYLPSATRLTELESTWTRSFFDRKTREGAETAGLITNAREELQSAVAASLPEGAALTPEQVTMLSSSVLSGPPSFALGVRDLHLRR